MLHSFNCNETVLNIGRKDGKVVLEVASSPEYIMTFGTSLSNKATIPTKTMVRKITKSLRYCAECEPYNYVEKFVLPNGKDFIEVVCDGGRGIDLRIWDKTSDNTGYMAAHMHFWEAKYIARAINGAIL